jgi:hypothetical protein
MILLPLLFFFAPPVETADRIMARVAANQERSESLRNAFLYHQTVLVRLKRTNGKLAREEYSEYTVTPAEKSVKKERTLFAGKYMQKGREVSFTDPLAAHKNLDVDADLARDLGGGFLNDSQSKDGIAHDLFPLTAKEQKKYDFTLEGTEEYHGMPVYRITFKPKKCSKGCDDEGDWTGEALVHQTEYQPALVITRLDVQIPVWVKTMLGTDLQHLGFKVTYRKFDEGLWFPVAYSGELKVRALFLYARRIGISMQNSDFRRAVVDSTVRFGQAP